MIHGRKGQTAKVRKKSPANESALPQRQARAALDRATKEINRLNKSASKNAWAIGRRLAQVAELELHRARGFTTIEDYAEAKLGISRDTTFLYMRVADAFSETVATLFGAEKLDRALRYIAATPEDEEPSDIPTLLIRVPREDGGEPVHKPFEKVTIADLRRATQNERAKSQGKNAKKKPPAWLTSEAAHTVEKSHQALAGAVGRAAAKSADVTVRRAAGEIVVDVRGVPIARAAHAFRALAVAMT